MLCAGIACLNNLRQARPMLERHLLQVCSPSSRHPQACTQGAMVVGHTPEGCQVHGGRQPAALKMLYRWV